MLTVFAVGGLPEFEAGDDLAAILCDALEEVLEDGDIIAVTSKIVSKAEGRVVGGEQAVIEALLRVVGPSGTVVMPAQSWQLCDPEYLCDPEVPREVWPLI